MPVKGRVDYRLRKRQQPGYVSPRIINIVGQRFGAWTVVGAPFRNNNKQTTWPCRCDCGTERDVVGQALRRGKTSSCGCLMGDAIAAAKTVHGQSANLDRRDPAAVSAQAAINRQSGEKVGGERGRSRYRQTTTYKRWLSMKKRVVDMSDAVWPYYGGKGITVCDRWRTSFDNFLADMGECPEGWTLDRIDPQKSYGPDNCRWATWSTQIRNRTMMEVCPDCGKHRVTCGSDRLELAQTG